MTVHGREMPFVVDTGSEVTVLPDILYQHLKSYIPVEEDVRRWFKIYGANGLEIPTLDMPR